MLNLNVANRGEESLKTKPTLVKNKWEYLKYLESFRKNVVPSDLCFRHVAFDMSLILFLKNYRFVVRQITSIKLRLKEQ